MAKGSSVSISVSHTDGMSVVAEAGSVPVGVDVERDRDGSTWQEIADEVFSSREQGLIAAGLSPAQLWARKEAVLKCRRTGLSEGVADVDVAACADWLAQHITLADLDVRKPFRAAIAVGSADAYYHVEPLHVGELVRAWSG